MYWILFVVNNTYVHTNTMKQLLLELLIRTQSIFKLQDAEGMGELLRAFGEWYFCFSIGFKLLMVAKLLMELWSLILGTCSLDSGDARYVFVTKSVAETATLVKGPFDSVLGKGLQYMQHTQKRSKPCACCVNDGIRLSKVANFICRIQQIQTDTAEAGNTLRPYSADRALAGVERDACCQA